MALEDQRDELRRDFSSEDRTALLRVSEDLRKIEQEMREQGISTEQALIDANKILLSPPPFAVSLIGRDRELAAYQKTLQQNQGLVLVGRAGIGKSVLGAALARRLASDDEHIFWLRFVSGLNTDVESVLWSLAVFLAQLGYDEPWRVFTIEQTRMDQSDRLSASVKMGLISAGLQEHATVLCFDDCHHLQDKELAASQEMSPILALLSDLVKQAKDYRVILMTRKQLPGMGEIPQEIVMGLSAQDSGNLVSNLAPVWSPEFNPMLHQYLKGNPQLLTMFAAILAHAPAAHDSIAKTLETLEDSRVGDYLNTELWAQLSESERLVLQVVSVFQQDAPEAALESILEERRVTGIQSLLRGMRRTGVVVYSRPEREGEQSRYSLHETLKRFCYNSLNIKLRRELHESLGAYFVQTDPLEAVYHFFEASKYNCGLKTLLTHKRTLLESGQVSAALRMIEKLYQRMFVEQPEQWITACELRGEWQQVVGEYKAARHSFAQALRLVEKLNLNDLQVGLYRWLGVVSYHQGEFQDSLFYLSRADELLETVSVPKETGIVRYWLARVNFLIGKLDTAKVQAQRSLDALKADRDKAWQVLAHSTLATIHFTSGDDESGMDNLGNARQLLETSGLDKTPEAATIDNNLGTVYLQQGQLEKAIQHFQRSLKIAERLGLIAIIVESSYNLGTAYLQMGRWDKANRYLVQALEKARRTRDQFSECLIQTSLGLLSHRQGDLDTAFQLYNEAYHLAQTFNYFFPRLLLLARLSELSADQDHYESAYDYADEGLLLAGDYSTPVYQVLLLIAMTQSLVGLRRADEASDYATKAVATAEDVLRNAPLLGLAKIAAGSACVLDAQWEQAEDYFNQAIDLLVDTDFYNLGRAEFALGQLYVYSDQKDLARVHLTKALETVKSLGSVLQVERVRQVLASTFFEVP